MARLQDEERRRIGREVHDSRAKELTAAKLYLKRIPEHSFADAQWSGFVKEAVGAVDRALQQVRSLSYLLHPPFAEDMGLLTAVRYYIEGVSQRTGIQAKAKLPKELQRLPFEMEAAIFRVVQESLTNIYRHSNSKVAEIELECKDGDGARKDPRLRRERHGGKGGRGTTRCRHQRNAGTRARAGRRLQVYDARPGTVVEVELPIAPPATKFARNGDSPGDAPRACRPAGLLKTSCPSAPNCVDTISHCDIFAIVRQAGQRFSVYARFFVANLPRRDGTLPAGGLRRSVFAKWMDIDANLQQYETGTCGMSPIEPTRAGCQVERRRRLFACETKGAPRAEARKGIEFTRMR